MHDISAKNLIKIGAVTAIYEDKGTIQVTFEDCDNMPVEMPLLSFEYNMPMIDSTVWCIFQGSSRTSGLCLGRAYSDTNPPPATDAKIFKKPLTQNPQIAPNAYYEYDETTQTLTIKAKHIVFDTESVRSTGEIGDKLCTMSAQRTIYNTHTHANSGAGPPSAQM